MLSGSCFSFRCEYFFFGLNMHKITVPFYTRLFSFLASISYRFPFLIFAFISTTDPALQSVCMSFIPGNLSVLSGGTVIL